MSWAGWVIAVGGPLLGIVAVMALVVIHEHGAQVRRLPVRVPAPAAPRRGSPALLYDYLADERDASASARRLRHAHLLSQMQRASTAVLDEFLEDRALPEPSVPVVAAPRPLGRMQPALLADRAPRPTRLVPLAREVAIG